MKNFKAQFLANQVLKDKIERKNQIKNDKKNQPETIQVSLSNT
jgi:hypothetical protein